MEQATLAHSAARLHPVAMVMSFCKTIFGFPSA